MAGKKGMHNKAKATVDVQNQNPNDLSFAKDDSGFLQLFKNLGGTNGGVMNNPYLQNQVLKAMAVNPSKYSREEINKMLANPKDSEEALVSLSHHVKNVILQYQGVIEYLSSINSYDAFTFPDFKPDDFDKQDKKFKKAYSDAITIVDELAVPSLGNRIAKGVLTEGSKFYYLAKTDYGFRLIELPRAWCKITALSPELSMYLFSFNMMWFKRLGVDVSQYGEWWIDALSELNDFSNKTILKPRDVEVEKRHDGSYAYWKELPVGFGWCFKYDNSTAVSTPPYAGLFNDALSIEDYKQMYNESAVINNWKLLLNKIGFNDDGKGGNNKLKITADFAKEFNDTIQRSVPKGVISAVSVFDELDVVDFSKNAQTKDNIVGTGQNNFFNGIGVSQNVMGGGENGGAVGITFSHYSDSEKIERAILPQLLTFINYILRENIKRFRFKAGIEVTTSATREAKIKLHQGLANSGLPIERLLASAGISQAEFEGCVAMESILGTREKLIPLLNANTISSTEAIDGKTKEKTDRTKVSDSTESSINNGNRKL